MCLYLKTGQGVCLPVKYINSQMRHLLSFINIYVDFHHLLYSSLLQKETMSSQKMRRSPLTISRRVTMVLLQLKPVEQAEQFLVDDFM